MVYDINMMKRGVTDMTNNLTWKLYRNGDEVIIGAAEWQTRARSITRGIHVFWAGANKEKPGLFARAIARARMLPVETAEAMKKEFNTYDRFEDACDAGVYGCEW
jgi:hypothetical protein